MGESYVTDAGDVVTRTVLPQPLVGYYESTRLASVTFRGSFTVDQEHAADLRTLLAELFAYPDGIHQFTDKRGDHREVEVTSRVSVTLNVGAQREDSDLTLLHTLLERLKTTSDVIEAVGTAHEPRVHEALVNAGFWTDMDLDRARVQADSVGAHLTVPSRFVWRRDG
jgi:hypothetical protein